MNTLKDEWHVGQAVWAAYGTIGWRPAVITHIGRTWIQIIFSSGKKTYGKRLVEKLRPRDRALDGKDKPQRLEAKENDVR